MQQTTAPMLLRIPDVAHRLALSDSTVYSLCVDGTLPAVKIGGSWRVHAKRLEAMIESATDSVDRKRTA